MLLASSLQPDSVVSAMALFQDKIQDVTGKGYNLRRLSGSLPFSGLVQVRETGSLTSPRGSVRDSSQRAGLHREEWVKTAVARLQGPSPSLSLDLNHRRESTYLGHLLHVEQPRQLQAQHLEAGLEDRRVTAGPCHQDLLKVLTWLQAPLASRV